MGMDIEPIYCAEQIVVPDNLAEILKAYTKEVIRRQPDNLIEFSAKYFANLANVAGAVHNTPAPTREQMKQVYTRAGGEKYLTSEQVTALSLQAGISEAVAAKVLEAGQLVEPGNNVDVTKYVFLLLAMSVEDFNKLLKGIFDVFSDTGSINADLLCQLMSYLGPHLDPSVTPEWVQDLKLSLPKPQLFHTDLLQVPLLAAKLGV